MAEVNRYEQDVRQVLPTLNLSVLQGSSVLVTGATGLIGGSVIDLLMLQGGIEVYAMGRNEQRARRRFSSYRESDRFHFVKADITQPLTGNTNYDYIIHAASNASPNFFQQQPVEVIKSNINGVEHLIEYGRSHQMKRLLYVSSGEIYGEGSGGIFTEADSGYVDCATPRACYPSSKRAAETLCVAYAAEYGVDVVIGRPCHTYGPYFTESDNRVYAQFIRNVLKGEDIVMKSAGLQYRSWLYVVDCAAALLTLLVRGASAAAYNIADEASNITIRQLAELLAAAGGRKVVMAADGNQNTTPITKAVFSTYKLRALGWQPQWGIAEGLRHTLEALR